MNSKFRDYLVEKLMFLSHDFDINIKSEGSEGYNANIYSKKYGKNSIFWNNHIAVLQIANEDEFREIELLSYEDVTEVLIPFISSAYLELLAIKSKKS